MPSFLTKELAYKVAFQGTHNFVTVQGENVSEWSLDKNYVLAGAEWKIEGSTFADSVKFQIVMGEQVLSEFAKGFFVCDGHFKHELYMTELVAGLKVRVIYNAQNAGAKMWMNLYLHEPR